jgi:iron complex outermembrane receptor protein
MKGYRASLVSGAAALGVAVIANPANAQQAPTTPDKTNVAEVGDIIVTANKQTSTVSKTPIAVTALDSQALATRGVVELRDLTTATPNVHIRTVSLASAVQVSIRGVSNADYNAGGQPAIATYLDGVLLSRPQGLAGALFDIDRIEILRGPQGTLYGRNATAGNVNIITAGPQHDFHAAASLSYGNYNEISANAMINVPISDTLAVRVAGSFRRNDGIYRTAKNNVTGQKVRNYGMAEDYAGRISVLWTPSSNFNWRVTVDQISPNGTPGTMFQVGANGKPIDGRDPFKNPFVSYRVDPDLSIRNLIVRSRMEYDFTKALSISYAAGYQHLKDGTQLEFAGAPSSFLDSYRGDEDESTYHEVNLTYNEGKIFNVLGANYTHELTANINPAHLYISPTVAIGFSSGTAGRYDYHDSSWGIFDQLTYKVTDAFHVIGGIRYSSEDVQRDGGARTLSCPLSFTYAELNAANAQTIPPAGCSGSFGAANKGHFTKVTWRAGVEYDLGPASLAYATVSTGFKAGGLNANSPGYPTTFAPENTRNYEAGLKIKMLGGRARLNAAVFLTDYSNLQITQFFGVPAKQVITNAGQARIYGIELEPQINITENDVISGFINYLHARFTRYDNAIDSLTNAVIPSLAGDRLVGAPDWSFRAEYKHIFELNGGGSITPSAGVYYQSKIYMRETNSPIDLVPAYAKVDLNITYTDPSDKWTVQGYVFNLTNKITANGSLQALGNYFVDYDPPRRFGLRVGYKF